MFQNLCELASLNANVRRADAAGAGFGGGGGGAGAGSGAFFAGGAAGPGAAGGAGLAAAGVVSLYPFFTFSAISLSCSLRACSSVADSLICVCPAVPIRPKLTVNLLPWSLMFQN